MTLPCEFYRNIWGPSDEEDAALRRRARSRKSTSSPPSITSRRYKKRVATGPLVDIAQVAHVVTTMSDFRADYGEESKKMRLVNIWDDDSLVLGLKRPNSSLNKWTDKKMGSEQGPSTADTEPEDMMSPLHSRADRITELSCEDSDGELSSIGSSVVNRLRPGKLKRANTPEIVRPSTVKNSCTHDNVRKELYLDNVPVPPPSSHNGSVIFSAVFSDQRDWSWSAKFLLGIHEPIRHALFVMDRFLEQSQSQSKPEASNTLALETHVAEFFVWFKTYFVEYLQCQHEVKASVLLPLLNLPASTKQQVLDVYQDISQMLVQIQQLERALCVSGACNASSWLLRLQVLQTEIRQLNRTLHAALNMEETTLHSAMGAAFTERAFHSHIMPRVFRAIRAKRVVVPWIVERSKIWGGETEQLSIQGMLPFSAKFMYRKIWRPYFMSNVAVAMKNLNEFVGSSGLNSNTSSTSTYSERHGEMCSIM
ncbi:unnamed protein product [Peronospora belbahrii]|uniref:Uncharacterized protein n=1 Tax=Peronospora belbahrii TaxID=622444 RepID=A0AAU9KU34_9STRA|nr:unnamed protein product [Peronospora belbahrii]CAH0516187.1 unnamed protein product [Peronospora belbahrii]